MKFDDIEMAFEHVSCAQPFINNAYISRKTGEVFYTYELADSDELPDDINDASIYITVPHKNDLNLGTSLAFEFVSEFLPNDCEQVSNIFSRKGAYFKFKQLLEQSGKLSDWYSFEEERKKKVLIEWCEDNNLIIENAEKNIGELVESAKMRRIRFLLETLYFVNKVRKLPGVTRIALIGSLTTRKPHPKDVDVLVTVTENTDIAPIAELGRKLNGIENNVVKFVVLNFCENLYFSNRAAPHE